SGTVVEAGTEARVRKLRRLEGQFEAIPSGAEIRGVIQCGAAPWRLVPMAGVTDPSGRFWMDVEPSLITGAVPARCAIAVAVADYGALEEPLTLALVRTRAIQVTPVITTLVGSSAPDPRAHVAITTVSGEPVTPGAVVVVPAGFGVEGSIETRRSDDGLV